MIFFVNIMHENWLSLNRSHFVSLSLPLLSKENYRYKHKNTIKLDKFIAKIYSPLYTVLVSEEKYCTCLTGCQMPHYIHKPVATIVSLLFGARMLHSARGNQHSPMIIVHWLVTISYFVHKDMSLPKLWKNPNQDLIVPKSNNFLIRAANRGKIKIIKSENSKYKFPEAISDNI